MSSRAGLMLLVLAIGSVGGVPLAAQETPQGGTPPISSPGVLTPKQEPRTVRRGVRPRRQRGRDAAVFSVQGSLGTNGTGGSLSPGTRNALVSARVISDLSTRLSVMPLVTPVAWQVSGEMGFRGYDKSEFMAVGRSLGTAAAWNLGADTHMNVNASASYQPIFSLYQPMVSTSAALAQMAFAQATAAATGVPIRPTAAIDAGALAFPPDFGAAKSPAYAGNVGFSVTQRLTSRISAEGSVQMAGTDFKAERNRDMKDWSAAGRISYLFMEGVGVHAGYRRRVVGYYRATGLETVSLDDLDVGLDVTRGFSVTKKGTTLDARTGSVITTDGKRRHFRATGKVDLTQALGRNANVSAGFERSVQLPPGFVRPVLTDALVAGAGGRLPREATWLVAASRSYGTVDPVGLGSAGSAYHTTTGTARVSIPLSQRAGLYVEYMAYQHDINQGADVPDVLARQELRQVGRIGVSLDVPLLRDTRRPRREPRRERP